MRTDVNTAVPGTIVPSEAREGTGHLPYDDDGGGGEAKRDQGVEPQAHLAWPPRGLIALPRGPTALPGWSATAT